MSQDGSTRGSLWQRWAGPEDDWIEKLIRDPPQKEDVITSLMKMMGQPTAHLTKNGGIPSKAPRDLEPFVLGPPTNTEGIALEFRRDKDGGRKDQWQGKAEKDNWSRWCCPETTEEWWSKGVDLRRRVDDWAV